MSRANKIAPEKAVDAAMACFWKHGYNTLGTRQLENETGITRFTLQKSYGGKWPLFLQTLDAYLDAFEASVCPSMQDGKLETIADWFDWRANPDGLIESARYGCLLLNTVVEFADTNADVNIRAERFFNMVRGGFIAALAVVKENEQVTDDFDVLAMAEVLLAATVGLNVVIRAGGSNAAGKVMAGSLATMILSWKKPVAPPT